MKYCVSGRQPKSILKQADEIKMQYKDCERILDYIEEFSNKTFIVEIPKDEIGIDWSLLNVFKEKLNNFILCVHNLNLINEIKEKDFKFYWAYPIVTWYELEGIAALNPVYLFLNAPLSFSLQKIKDKYNIPIRLCPNIAYDSYIPRDNGIYGTWIRPEDVQIYENWVDTFEFITDDLKKESTLIHIYKDNKQWPGNLNLLLTNLNYNVDNRAIPEKIGKIRANCEQKCKSGGSCKFCSIAFKFATDVRNKYYKDKLNKIREQKNEEF